MLSRKIENVRAALGELAGKVSQNEWETISLCRRLLEDAQSCAAALESNLIVPEPQTETTAQAH